MRRDILFSTVMQALLLISCTPVEKIAFHDLSSGYYKMKKPENEPSKVYIKVNDDSITVFNTFNYGRKISVDTAAHRGSSITAIRKGNPFNGSSFVKNSADIDLSTVLLKFRPARGGVPNQLNANLNAALYVGFRKDYYKMVTNTSPLNEETTFSSHAGFDFGLFAGFGITQINPTVTNDQVTQEYDGIIFQKGVGFFVTLERMSVGIVLGFDNLMDGNKSVWLYNQKPYLGLSLGIANF
jgi:hypothetical protein